MVYLGNGETVSRTKKLPRPPSDPVRQVHMGRDRGRERERERETEREMVALVAVGEKGRGWLVGWLVGWVDLVVLRH